MQICEGCSKKKHVLMTITHGKKEWQLCSSCWRECLDREPLGNIPKRYREDGFTESPA